jgi:hypothetical protein
MRVAGLLHTGSTLQYSFDRRGSDTIQIQVNQHAVLLDLNLWHHIYGHEFISTIKQGYISKSSLYKHIIKVVS